MVAGLGSSQLFRRPQFSNTFESQARNQARRPVSRAGGGQAFRSGRQFEDSAAPGVDFSTCVQDRETGLCCVDKEETVSSLEKDSILECTHKNTEQCHYT